MLLDRHFLGERFAAAPKTPLEAVPRFCVQGGKGWSLRKRLTGCDYMRVVESLDGIPGSLDYPVIAIGVFDGVHRGHQEIIRKMVARTRNRNGTTILLSFFPHPQKVIASGDAPPLLQTFEQRAELLETLGIDFFLRLPFTRSLSMSTPEEFVQQVLLPIGAVEVHVGANFRFGHRRSGNLETLTRLGEIYGFEVCDTEPVYFRGQRVSSTRVRNLIREGRVALAKRLLGRAYEIRGNVVRGAGRGAELGFPTANLKTQNELLPATGVYVTRAHLSEHSYLGATNVGYRPTVHGYAAPEPTIETHLFDFSGNLYGREMTLEFCFRLRDEKRFNGLQALTDQVQVDILRCRRYREKIEPLVERDGE